MEATRSFEILESDYPKPESHEKASYPPIIRLFQFGFMIFGRLFPKSSAKWAYKLFSTPRYRARHKKSDEILEKAQLFEFMYGKDILKGYEWGKGERTILLVHGWESRGTAMRSFVPTLVAKGFRVVAFDGPAHGNSAGKRTNLPHFGGAIKAIINRLGGVEGIIAHSFGGASTVFTIANLDESISLKHLVLIGVPSSLEKIYEDFIRLIQAPQPTARHLKKMLEDRINMPVEEADVSRSQTINRIKETLIIHDREDQIVPFVEAKTVAEHWSNTRFLITEGYGHFQLMKNPDVVNRVVDFLD